MYEYVVAVVVVVLLLALVGVFVIVSSVADAVVCYIFLLFKRCTKSTHTKAVFESSKRAKTVLSSSFSFQCLFHA